MSKASILVIEDEQVIALDIQQCLEELGYTIAGSADNGAEAVNIACDCRPDLVLMDIMLKGNMDGTEAGAKISAAGIPVIYLTAYSDASTVHRAAESAPYGFLTKPYERNELAATLEVALYKARLEQHLRDSERWFSTTLRCMSDGIIVTDSEARLQFLNPVAEQLTGWSNADAKGEDLDIILKLGDATTLMPEIWRVLRENSAAMIARDVTLTTRNGRGIVVEYSAAPIRDQGGRAQGVIVVLRDTATRSSLDQRLRESEAYFRQIFEQSPVGMALVGLDGNLLSVNPSFAGMLGYRTEDMLGRPHIVFSNQDNSHWEGDYLNDLLAGRASSVQFDKRYLHSNGERMLWTLVNVTLLQDPARQPRYLYQVHDMSEHHEAAARLELRAKRDHLTGVYNRYYLDEELQRAINYSRRYNASLTVAFVDLDHFKQINDSLGHDAGDEVLRTVARRLQSVLRDTDCVARYGGDEFVLILHRLETQQQIAALMEKLLARIASLMVVDGRNIYAHASIGVCRFPLDGDDPKLLLRHADRALLEAKSAGRNRVCFFEEEA